jgi:photosystem II stability/assembly factor-like uncharacterized protein
MRLAIALTAALAAGAPAAAETWLPVGPAGGDVRSLSIDPRQPGILYLGTANGILYKSEDAGERWRRLEPGFPTRGKSLDNLIVDPRGRILIGYWEVGGTSGGVARSSDDGRSFALLPGIEGHSVRGLAIAPSNPDVIVASAIDGVFRSDDGGDSWRRISPAGHAELRNVESVAIDPTDPDVVYVGTWHLPWKTMDGGRTWRSTHEGMIDDSDVFVMMLDHRTPRTVYATACTGIYRSVDAGARWVKAKGIPTSSRRTRAFAQDPERPDTLYAGTTEGLFKSEDGMATWRLMTSKDLVVNSIAMLPRARGGTLLLGTEGAGVLRSSDGGETWSASNEGFSERLFSRVLFDGPRRPCPGRGPRRSPTRRRVRGTPLRGPLGQAGPGPGGARGALPGPRALGHPGGNGRRPLPVRARRGRLETPRNPGRRRRRPSSRIRRPGPAGADLPGGHLARPPAQRRWWHDLDPAEPRFRRVGAGAGRGGSRPEAADGGHRPGLLPQPRCGIHLGAGIPRPGGPRGAFAGLPSGRRKVLFATTPEGLLKSTDQGRVWQKRGRGLPDSDIRGLALTADGRILYASDFARGGLYRSGDAGETWREVSVSGLGSDRVWTVAVDPASPETLLAASSSGGLHLLTPPAAGWSCGTTGRSGRAQE